MASAIVHTVSQNVVRLYSLTLLENDLRSLSGRPCVSLVVKSHPELPRRPEGKKPEADH